MSPQSIDGVHRLNPLDNLQSVLVTGANGPAGYSLVQQLRERGLHVIATDIVSGPVEDIADVFVTGLRADNLELIPFLLQLCRDENLGIDLFIPTVQDELLTVATAAPLFPCPVLISPVSAVALAHDKFLTAEYAALRDLPIPATLSATVDSSLWEKHVGFPLVAKPRVSRGGRGVQVLDSAEALESADFSASSEDIVQAFAPGAEYCPQLYRSPLTHEISTVVLAKTKLKSGRVGNAAEVLRVDPAESAEAAEVASIAQQIMSAFGLYGAVDMDIRLMPDRQPVLLEINARFGANSANTPEMINAVLEDVEHGAFAPFAFHSMAKAGLR